MDKGLNKAFEKLTETLQYTRDKDVISIKACMNVDKDGFHKEVAKITFSNGSKIYADIGGDANTTAMYDVLAVLCQLKPKSKNIYKMFENAIDNAPTIEPQRMRGKWETIEGWDGDEVYRCSKCGEEYVLMDGTPKDNGYHFCPNCGADMRGTE